MQKQRLRGALDGRSCGRPGEVAREMHTDTAVDARLQAERPPLNRLGAAANVLVFPNLAASNAAYKLL